MKEIDLNDLKELDSGLRDLIEIGKGLLLRVVGVQGFVLSLRVRKDSILLELDESGKFVKSIEKCHGVIEEFCKLKQNFEPKNEVDVIFDLIRNSIPQQIQPIPQFPPKPLPQFQPNGTSLGGLSTHQQTHHLLQTIAL